MTQTSFEDMGDDDAPGCYPTASMYAKVIVSALRGNTRHYVTITDCVLCYGQHSSAILNLLGLIEDMDADILRRLFLAVMVMSTNGIPKSKYRVSILVKPM